MFSLKGVRLTLLIAGTVRAAFAAAQPTPGVPLSENFDGVTAPALPPGWVATNAQGPDPLWVTDTTVADTAPNAAHVDDPDAVSDKRLDSPPIPIMTNQAQLRFKQITKFAQGADLSFVDGGVLEISIDGGPFQDIEDAGGQVDYSIYPITGAANPLNGRHGWTWTDPTYFSEEIVTLPPLAGHTISLRWRLGSGGGDSVTGHGGWFIDSIRICDGAACDAVPSPRKMDLDTAGNGVWEIGEQVDVDPYYYNNGGSSLDLTGVLTGITGPGDPGLYDLIDGNGSYGTVPPGALGGCAFTGDCYSVHLKNTGGDRPVQHWDAQLSEQLSNGVPVTWALHIGGSFTDVPSTNQFYYYIETLFHRGVTGGCGLTYYCPVNPALREQMAVFLLKSKYGRSYVPPPATGIFADVPASDPFAPWIENLYNLGITGGCSASPLQYCPNSAVLREQMSVFLLKTLLGSGYAPPACTGIFEDVPCPSLFADWIEDLYDRQIAAGCGNGDFCPDHANTRGQMAAFLVKTFGLRLYGQ